MPVQKLKRQTTSSEFVLWKAYLEWDLGVPTRVEWYLAQIALEVARKFAKNPKRLKLKHFILRFEEYAEKARKKKQPSGKGSSKQIWLAWLGIKLDKDGQPLYQKVHHKGTDLLKTKKRKAQ
jgi:hypothetical protein